MTSITSFSDSAVSIRHALIALDTAASSSANRIQSAMQGFIDSCAGLPKDEATTKAIGAEIRTNEDVLNMVAEGFIEAKTITNYAQGAMRAFFHGKPWTSIAFQAEDKGGLPALPWSKGAKKTDKAPTAAKITNPLADAHAAMCKALTLYRKANAVNLAADMLDLIRETFPEFTEADEGN